MVITSTSNPTIRSVRQLHARKGRRGAGRTLVEGPNGLEALIRHGVVPELLVVTEDDGPSMRFAADVGVDPIVVTEHVLAAASDTRSPASPVAVITVPEAPPLRLANSVVLVDIADPGNVGTIVRTASALGWDVGVAGRTTDPWGPKAIRSAAGTTLGAHIASSTDPIREATDLGLATVALVADGGEDPAAVRAKLLGGTMTPVALLVGSEAHGLPESVADAAAHRVTIPMVGDVESLNASVAAAIGMHALQ